MTIYFKKQQTKYQINQIIQYIFNVNINIIIVIIIMNNNCDIVWFFRKKKRKKKMFFVCVFKLEKKNLFTFLYGYYLYVYIKIYLFSLFNYRMFLLLW